MSLSAARRMLRYSTFFFFFTPLPPVVGGYHISPESPHSFLRPPWITLILRADLDITCRSLWPPKVVVCGKKKRAPFSSIKRLSKRHKSLGRFPLFPGCQVGTSWQLPFVRHARTTVDSLWLVSFSSPPQRPHQEISGHRPSQTARQHEGELVRLPVSVSHMAARRISSLDVGGHGPEQDGTGPTVWPRLHMAPVREKLYCQAVDTDIYKTPCNLNIGIP